MSEFRTFAAQEMLTKVDSLATLTLVWGFKGELAQLRKSFFMLEDMLRDAEHSQAGRGAAVEMWVKKLEDIAHYADDVLDDYGYELLRRKVERQNQMKKKKVLNFLSLSNPIALSFRMAYKIENINKSLVILRSEAFGIGLVAGPIVEATTSHNMRGERETHSGLDEDIIFGRDQVVSDIVEALTDSNKNQESKLSVMAIVGLGGLGKTTVAKSIFHDAKIHAHFHVRLWVCVSTPFEIKSILRGVLECLNPQEAAVRTIDAMFRVLKEELQGKRYLLVLDDVWNEEWHKWEELKSCLLRVTDSQGSKIIVTTRKDKVGKIVETLPRPDLEKLSVEDCWRILKDKSIGSAPITEDQAKIGRRIATKCGGVPLVAKVLGHLMRSETSDGWQSIAESEIWDLPQGKERILSILKLSFDELRSPSLKLCFAYCSMFMKDFEIEKDDLIQLWMAQGWLHPSPDRSMEDMGDEYFNILLGNSFFQDFTKDSYGNITKCKMHDLGHDLAAYVSKSKNFRSIFSTGKDFGNTLDSFKALRVLNLYKADIEVLPDSIGKLKHLRYLNVSKTNIKVFPKSIGQLYNLQTLKIPYQLEEFPREVANLINLRHVYFGRYMKVPAGILRRLTNLRSLPFVKVGKETGPGIEELGGVNQLKGTLSIHNLEHVRDGQEAKKANLVEKQHVRKLILVWRPYNNVDNNDDVLEGLLPHVRDAQVAEKANLVEKKQIRKLILGWKLSSWPSNNVDNDEDVLEGLQPHPNLEFLEIQGFMGVKFTLWLLLANNLKEIELLGCNNCEGLPVLGHLPNLKRVKVKSMDKLTCIGSEFYGAGTTSSKDQETRCALFPALKTLHIEEARNLIEWMEAPTERASSCRVFPCLEELTLIDCYQLTKAPSHFPSLQKLVIHDMDSGMAMASILSNQLTTLTHLEIKWVQGLSCLPEEMLENNKNLEHLEIISCWELTCIAPQPQGFEYRCESLSYLKICFCASLRYLPDGLLAPSLKLLILSFCHNLETIPSLDKLTSLRSLNISYCERLKCLPNALVASSLCSLTRLKTLTIGPFCEELESCPAFQAIPQLESLKLYGWPKLKSLPEQIQCFTSLTRLDISGFDGMEAMPEWLGNLASLEYLTIIDCTNLMHLPSVEAMQRLTKLKHMYIYNCPLLRKRCTEESGPEWPKIRHLPFIHRFSETPDEKC